MKAKLIIALMYNEKNILNKTLGKLKKIFGKIDLENDEYNFNFTDYYKKEFGNNLMKKIISFKDLINREELADIKLKTINIEKELSVKGKRRINIDPGYLTLHNLVLASTKELPHRIFIGKGIFAESTLFFRNKQYNDYPYTFKDYQQEIVKEFLIKVRSSLVRNY